MHSNIGVNVTLLQDPEKHWGRPFFAGVNGCSTNHGTGLAGISQRIDLNTVSAHITQQTDQIGVMKSLGASTLIIAKHYLTETLIMAFAAIVWLFRLSLAGRLLQFLQITGVVQH